MCTVYGDACKPIMSRGLVLTRTTQLCFQTQHCTHNYRTVCPLSYYGHKTP